MHMVSKKDSTSAELETMRMLRNSTTLMTEVQTRKDATIYVKELDLFVEVMFLEETLAVLSLGKLCEDIMGIGPAVKNHISEKARELIAIFQLCTFCGSLFYQRVLPQLHLHLLLHHLYHRIPYLTSTDTPKIQYQKELEVRVESFGETRCTKPQKPKTKIKMGNQKKYKEKYRMNCLSDYRNSERIWLMKLLQQSLVKPRAWNSRHFQVIS